jgi:hypothetical protein
MRYLKVLLPVTSLLCWMFPVMLPCQQLPEVVKDGVRYYAPTQPFYNLQCVGPLCPSGGSSGFPLTLGTTSIPANGTIPALTGITVNGVTLQTGGATNAFLNRAGGYSSPSGASVQIKFMSVAGCPQDADPNAGGGTDGTACVNALFAGADATTAIEVVQDKGFTTISGNGIICPAAGNCILAGEGGGIAQTLISNCSISGGVAILTAVNTLAAGQKGTFGDMVNCPTLTNQTLTVLSAGLSGTQFEVAASGTVAGGADAGTFNQVRGTGFFLAAGSRDMFSNGPWGSGTNCDVGAGAIAPRGANIQLLNIVMNGNAPNNSDYCFGADFNNINGIVMRDVVFFNAAKYSVKMANVGNVVLDGDFYFSTSPLAGTNTDGDHFEGPANDIIISNSHYKVSDDAIALNAFEGFCGPITRVEITNSTLDNSFNAVRAYNSDLNTCTNGLVPLISQVDISKFSGRTLHFLTLGAGETGLGTLNPAITDFRWSDSTIEQTGNVATPVLQQDNVGNISFSNFTLRSSQSSAFYQIGDRASGAAHLGNVLFNGVTFVDTASGQAISGLMLYGLGNTVGTVQVDNLSLVVDGGGTPATFAPLAPVASYTGSSVGQVVVGNIDPTNMTSSPFGSSPSSIIPSLYASVYAIQALTTFDGTTIQIPHPINITGAVTANEVDTSGALGIKNVIKQAGANYIYADSASFHPYSAWNVSLGTKGNGWNEVWSNDLGSNIATQPSGSCGVQGQWVFSQDGHATYCNGTTWVSKI